MPPCLAAPGRSRAPAVALLVALALAVGGCSGDSSSSGTPPAGAAAGGGGPAPVASKILLGKVAGTIKKKNWKLFMQHHREPTLKQVGQAVDTWIDGGFVGVDYPRDSFDSAFAAFTAPAKEDAERQRSLMTNWDLRKEIDGVDVKRRTVTVDVLAPRGQPAGATARVDLVFSTGGDTSERVAVRGRLFLSPGRGGWHIFGYDVSRGAR